MQTKGKLTMKLPILTATLLLLCLLLGACSHCGEPAQIAATTLPVYEFTSRLCQDTDLTVTQLIDQSVSCLHDYTLNVDQARAVEHAELIVLSGGGLEDFMTDLLTGKQILDSSRNVPLLESCHDHNHDHGHHEEDAHIWLSPANARIMVTNIYEGLCQQYPQHKQIFEKNLIRLLADVDALEAYGAAQLSSLSCRELITFHDGFAYFAEAFDLTILSAVEEEYGSEASAAELKTLIRLVREHHLPAIFTETNGSTAAARIISAETGATVFALDMAMSGNSWLEAMYKNINTVKEALG